eukprot:COSAG02_NODE_33273_length_502_cov_3.811414_1_plen_59_part_10
MCRVNVPRVTGALSIDALSTSEASFADFWGNSIFVLFWKLDVGVVGKKTLDDKTGWEGR